MDTNDKTQQTKLKYDTLLDYKTHIEKLIPFVDKPSMHNWISFELSTISEKYGKDVMYETIVELGLDKIGWKTQP